MQSLDTLYYVLAGSIAAFTVFLCVMLYYIVRMLKNAVYTMEKFTNVLKKLDELADLAKEKMNSGGTYLAMAVSAVQSIVEMVGSKKKTTRKRKSK